MSEKGDYVSSGLAGADAQKIKYAGMAELADALDSGSSGGDFVQVQVLLPAPSCLTHKSTKTCESFFFLHHCARINAYEQKFTE